MPLHIHQAKVLWRRGRLIQLDELCHIFTCPVEECEYVMTARVEDEAVTLRDIHMRTNHPMDLATMRWEEAFETDVPPYVERVLNPSQEIHAL